MKEKSMPVFGMLSLFFSVSVIAIALCILCSFLIINPILVAFLFLGILSLVLGINGIIKEENKIKYDKSPVPEVAGAGEFFALRSNF